MRFKNDDFDISDKERSGHLAVKENEMRINGKKSWKRWKRFRLIYIVSIFYCNKKNCKKLARTFASTYI